MRRAGPDEAEPKPGELPPALAAAVAATGIVAALVALAWWYLMPAGFPLTHPRFWANTVLPAAALGAGVAGIAEALRGRRRLLAGLALLFGSLPIGAAIAGKGLFPVSVAGLLLVLAVAGAATGTFLLYLGFGALERSAASRTAGWAWILAGLLVGALLPWSQRGADPATKPSGSQPSPLLEEIEPGARDELVGALATVSPVMGRVVPRHRGMTLAIYPLLTFHSRSPDRFWTLWAPRAASVEPRRSLVGLRRSPGELLAAYQDLGRSRLHVQAQADSRAVVIEAESHLTVPVYSHLNSFTTIRITAEGPISVAFSPSPVPIELKEYGYPAGQPMRLAYLDARGVFRVVEARRGEKGPFRTLAEGTLDDAEPLHVTLFTGDQPTFRLTFFDWAQQASRQLSPTAGWSLPENAIEFCLDAGLPGQGVLSLTLAGTSVGRGWDSVGHAAGVYRNRIVIEPLNAGEP